MLNLNEYRQQQANWLDEVADHIAEAGEIVPYRVNDILEVLYRTDAPTPKMFDTVYNNTRDVFRPPYLHFVAAWIRDTFPVSREVQ